MISDRLSCVAAAKGAPNGRTNGERFDDAVDDDTGSSAAGLLWRCDTRLRPIATQVLLAETGEVVADDRVLLHGAPFSGAGAASGPACRGEERRGRRLIRHGEVCRLALDTGAGMYQCCRILTPFVTS